MGSEMCIRDRIIAGKASPLAFNFTYWVLKSIFSTSETGAQKKHRATEKLFCGMRIRWERMGGLWKNMEGERVIASGWSALIGPRNTNCKWVFMQSIEEEFIIKI